MRKYIATLIAGVALISAAALFTSSLRDTFGRILDRSVTADFIVSNPSFLAIPAEVGERIAALPDMQAVSPVRPVLAKVDGDQIGFSAIDPVAFPELVDVDVNETPTAVDVLVRTRVADPQPADHMCAGIGLMVPVTVTLTAPLGDRTILDASCQRVVDAHQPPAQVSRRPMVRLKTGAPLSPARGSRQK